MHVNIKWIESDGGAANKAHRDGTIVPKGDYFASIMGGLIMVHAHKVVVLGAVRGWRAYWRGLNSERAAPVGTFDYFESAEKAKREIEEQLEVWVWEITNEFRNKEGS